MITRTCTNFMIKLANIQIQTKTRARNKKCSCKGKSYETTFEEKTVPL